MQTATPTAAIRWRCRRSRLELDLLLSAFLDNGYETLDDKQRGEFALLLEQPDETLIAWLIARKTPDNRQFEQLLDRIRDSATA